MTAAARQRLRGLDRFEARKKIVEQLENERLLAGVKDYVHSVGVHGKCDSDIEPMISRQWFVKIEPLARSGIDAVRNGTIQIISAELGGDVLQLDGKHPRLDDLAPALGGVIACRRTPARTATPSSAKRAEKRVPIAALRKSRKRTDVLDTWFSRRGCGRSRRWGGRRRRDTRSSIQQTFWSSRLRHPSFLVARMIMFGLLRHPIVENGHSPDENQVSSTSVSCGDLRRAQSVPRFTGSSSLTLVWPVRAGVPGTR